MGLAAAATGAVALKASLRPQLLKRYRAIATLLVKYGHSDLLGNGGHRALGVRAARRAGAPDPTEFARDLEALGPTYIKLGQLLSTRPDLLQVEYLEALTRLQDQVEPFPFAEVERIVGEELDARMSKAFTDFDPVPIAAASLGQVHRASLRDGRTVAVKVQRPGISQGIMDDLEALAHIASLLDHHTEAGRRYELGMMLGEFKRSLVRELDYRIEAGNLVTLAANLAQFERIVVPSPVNSYSTERVLTMDYVAGTKVTDLSPLARMDLDGDVLANELFKAYLKQVLIDGFFHADPHPGNVLLTDSHDIALIDLGMVARVGEKFQEDLLRLLVAVSDSNSDEAAGFAVRIGTMAEGFDRRQFEQRVSELVAEVGDEGRRVEVGRILLQVAQVAGDCGLRLPSELTMLSKTLLNLDQVGWSLDPNFDPNQSVREQSAWILQERLARSASPGNLLTAALDMKDFMQALPGRVNSIMDAVAANQIEFKIKAIDEARLMTGFQKIANRITIGLVLSALIVGASLLMRVETSFHLFGYPGLAMICFLLAAGGAVILITDILRNG